jgi:hypothetical protein
MNTRGSIVTNRGNRGHLAEHNGRVFFLDTLACLVGCKESIGGMLPDGKRPDVLRMDSKREVLFIGDAKNTEAPSFKETQVRLLGYLRWLAAYVTKENRVGIFAICFGEETESAGWVQTILMLAHEIGFICFEHGITNFDPELNIAWFIFSYGVFETMASISSYN